MKRHVANSVVRAFFALWISVTLVFLYATLFYETPVRNATDHFY